MQTIDCIKTRRSIRSYLPDVPSREQINEIISIGSMTPSGKNGQPWRVKIVSDKLLIDSISSLSIYKSWMKNAPILMVIYLDKKSSYHYVKDVQACGAFMQTIMLAAHDKGLGSCWIGEIISKRDEVNTILNIDGTNLDLMGIITVGYAAGRTEQSERKSIQDILL